MFLILLQNSHCRFLYITLKKILLSTEEPAGHQTSCIDPFIELLKRLSDYRSSSFIRNFFKWLGTVGASVIRCPMLTSVFTWYNLELRSSCVQGTQPTACDQLWLAQGAGCGCVSRPSGLLISSTTCDWKCLLCDKRNIFL